MTGTPTITQINEQICERFVAQWVDGADQLTEYTFDAENFTAPNDSEWVRVTIRYTGGGQETLGQSSNRKFERVGLIIGSIFVPANSGTKTADVLAQTFKEIFEAVNFGDVKGRNARVTQIGTDGLWYQVEVECDFVYYETK